mgnify:CR=1 FL=1
MLEAEEQDEKITGLISKLKKKESLGVYKKLDSKEDL